MRMSPKYLLVAFLALACALQAHAQEDVWTRVKEVNFPQKSLEASWQRVYKSPMLQDAVESEGKVALTQPDQVRWETLKPVQRVTVLDGSQPRGRFRLPTEKDFKVTILEGDQYTVQLDPVRRDLKQLVAQIALTVDKKTYKLLYVTILGVDGDWTQITFTNVVME